MASLQKKWEDNTPGRYYVDRDCIFCALCHELAPKNFKESATGDHDHVFKQPQGSVEEAQCEEALKGCPVEAIGKDGEM